MSTNNVNTFTDTNGRLIKKTFTNKELETLNIISLDDFLLLGDYKPKEIQSVRLKIYESLFPNELDMVIKKIVRFFNPKKTESSNLENEFIEYVSMLNDHARLTGKKLENEYLKNYFEGFLAITDQRKGKVNIFDSNFLETHQEIIDTCSADYVKFRTSHLFPEDVKYIETEQDIFDSVPDTKQRRRDIQEILNRVEVNTIVCK